MAVALDVRTDRSLRPRVERRPLERPDLEHYRRRLAAPLSGMLGSLVSPMRISLLRPVPTGVADATMQLLVRSADGAPDAVVLCSSPVAPDLIARAMESARVAKYALGPELGARILDPLGEGEIFGTSYAVLPYCRPLSQHWLTSRLESRLVAGSVLRWLRDVSKATQAGASDLEVEGDFGGNLGAVAGFGLLPAPARARARTALERMYSGAWRPRYVLMHQDLWTGNILLDDRHEDVVSRVLSPRFVVIDWPGSMVRGFGFYDLVRFTDAISFTRWELRREIEAHAELLGCEPRDAVGYFLAAIGHIARHLEHFPPASLARMTVECLDKLEQAGV